MAVLIMNPAVFIILLALSPSIPGKVLSKNHKPASDENSGEDQHNSNANDTSEFWMEVPLDHFNLFDNRTWKMRYFVDDQFFTEGNPIFIEIGGEWTVGVDSVLSGPLVPLAKKHNGTIIATEHRYYGESLPFGKDFSLKRLKYLQIEQALEDLAFLIEKFKATVPGTEGSKVVVHGCSYAGMLATWVRLRFPHLVDIAYASSAPLGVGLNFPEYFATVNDVYANVSVSCIDTIRKGFNETERLLRSSEGRKRVKNALKGWSCGNVNEMSSGDLLYAMANILNVQSDPLEFEEISCLILRMNVDELSDFERLTKLVVSKSVHTYACSSSSDYPEGDEDMETIAWLYQVCTEVGFFQTLSREKHPFAVDLTIGESVEQCTTQFGEGITQGSIEEGIRRTNRRYGGRNPKVTKLVSAIGKNDPWTPLAKIDDSDREAPVIVFSGSHCIDTIDYEESEELRQKRRKIRNIISNWLKAIS